jgi:hypothetical protein
MGSALYRMKLSFDHENQNWFSFDYEILIGYLEAKRRRR